MPRTGRGGPREGTPGKAYSNRTDLSVNRAPMASSNTAATGGQVTPVPAAPQGPPPDAQTWTTPDAVPSLDAPTERPQEPVTAGLPIGPGPGPQGPEIDRESLLAMERHLPWLSAVMGMSDTPASVRNFVGYLQSQVRMARQ